MKSGLRAEAERAFFDESEATAEKKVWNAVKREQPSKIAATPVSGGGGQPEKLGSQAFSTSLRDENNSKINVLKKAFTLAEVLITLGIIGIVAALTMPSIIAKYHKQKVEVGLEKFYSTFSQAIKMSEIDNGSVEYWDYPTGHEQCYDWYNKYLSKYLKKVKICRTPRECKIEISGNAVTAPLIVLSDGSMVSIWVDNKLCFYVRVNDGRPSKEGINTFRFILHPTRFQSPLMPDTYIQWVDGVQPGFHDITDREALWATCNKFPQRCAALIMHEGWKIPKDYPYNF